MSHDYRKGITWLHLSDIHFVRSIEQEGFRQRLIAGTEDEADDDLTRFGLSGMIWNQKPDCIIATGDFFHKGRWGSNDTESLREFLLEIYGICSAAGDWGWSEGEPLARLFYCPGNHDVNRHATHEADGVFSCRDDLVASEAKTLEDDASGDFDPSNRELLIFDTFRPFYTTLRSIVGEGHDPDALRESFDRHEFEARVFQVPDEQFSRYAFVGLNTAILAGVVPPREECLSRASKAWTRFLDAHHGGRTEAAKQAYDDYASCMYGAFGYADDFGRLAIPSSAARARVLGELEAKQANPYVIVFGHHPLVYLSERARATFKVFLEKLHSSVYLCGHTHVPRGSVVPIDVSRYYESVPVSQVTTGGVFSDEDEYNEVSISFGRVTIGQDSIAKCDATVFAYGRDPFGRWTWTRSDRCLGKLSPLNPTAGRASMLRRDVREGRRESRVAIGSSLPDIRKVAADLGLQDERIDDDDSNIETKKVETKE